MAACKINQFNQLNYIAVQLMLKLINLCSHTKHIAQRTNNHIKKSFTLISIQNQ